MAQNTRHPGPGTYVRDVLALELLGDGSGGTKAITTTGSEAAKVSERPANVSAFMTVGAVTGTGVTIDVEIQGADDSGFTSNVVTIAKFDTLTETSDNSTKRLDLVIYKPYVRAVSTVAGSTPSGALNVTLRTKDDRRNNTATA